MADCVLRDPGRLPADAGRRQADMRLESRGRGLHAVNPHGALGLVVTQPRLLLRERYGYGKPQERMRAHRLRMELVRVPGHARPGPDLRTRRGLFADLDEDRLRALGGRRPRAARQPRIRLRPVRLRARRHTLPLSPVRRRAVLAGPLYYTSSI